MPGAWPGRSAMPSRTSEVASEPARGVRCHHLQRPGLLEQMRGPGDDLQAVLDVQLRRGAAGRRAPPGDRPRGHASVRGARDAGGGGSARRGLVPKPLRGCVMASLSDLAMPLASADDLTPLLERIGDARYVLLGEASHGTSEYYAWRARLSR